MPQGNPLGYLSPEMQAQLLGVTSMAPGAQMSLSLGDALLSALNGAGPQTQAFAPMMAGAGFGAQPVNQPAQQQGQPGQGRQRPRSLGDVLGSASDQDLQGWAQQYRMGGPDFREEYSNAISQEMQRRAMQARQPAAQPRRPQ